MWYRFEEGNPKGIPRVKQYQVCWYDMDTGGGCFDESFYSLNEIDNVITRVETIEDENHISRTRVFVHMDDGDIYELKMHKLSKEQWHKCNKFYGGKEWVK